MRVSKWGNSLAIRLPAAVVEVMGLSEGDDVELIADFDAKRVRVRAKPSTDELWERVRSLRGRLPKDFKFDRDEANER
jgi:antitoxin MazE